MKLPLRSPISLGLFTHVPSTKSYVTEASDLGEFNIFQQIYDDACDVGFLVRNPGTNRIILVTLFKTNVEMNDDDGEVTDWVFTPCERAVRDYPKLKNYKFVIYND
jgi:hypothetical protein